MAVLDYGRVDVKALSYSRLSTLHLCARKFELENKLKLNTDRRSSYTFSFGHAVGMAVQATAEGDSYDMMMLRVIREWDVPLDVDGTQSEERAKKSLWFAMEAADRWWAMMQEEDKSLLAGWEVAEVVHPDTGEKVPAVELTFRIDCGDGYIYEGHIDLIVYNKLSNKFKVIELKTNSGNMCNPAQYKKSNQAVGYSVVIDKAAELLGSGNTFDVQYLVYMTKQMRYESLPFIKTPKDRADFVSNLITDIQYIDMLEAQDYYPTNGASCFAFFRECEYYSTCHMSNEALELMKAKASDDGNDEVFEETGDDFAVFNFKLEDLLKQQGGIAQSVLESNDG